ncbi:hypothetical protein NCR96_08420 [Helicobacter sp. 14348-15]|uniref:hypothetical protein n=1 Tax=Helicobacter colisuis TaxID=2949739 RepID=UPI00202B635F|nr:hypothetical protein [Helicobacter colisuis]MCL9821757.1 hypothetical protein [Helicobacter colisuis]
MFDFLNENRNVASRSSRIRLSTEHDKVELLSGTKSTKNVRDLFDYGFYIYCQNKDLKLSDYDYDGIQSSTQHRIKSHFSINGKEVWCDNAQQKLYIGENKFQINFNTNIFEEFEKVISQITN